MPKQRAHLRGLLASTALLGLAACAGEANQPVSIGFGPKPTLPPPQKSLIPALNIAEAKRWSGQEKPVTPPGLQAKAFAKDLDHPRWLYVLPNGDVLVAETNAPERPEEGKGIRGFVQTLAQKKAGAVTPSANRISLLRDTNGDGVSDTKTAFIEGLNSPFGMALVGDQFYVANTDAVVTFPYSEGQTEIRTASQKVAHLPAGPRNHHWTKNIVASPDGGKLYATVGSNSNAGENGLDAEQGRAAIWEIDLKSGDKRLYATGIRNPNGMDWEPETGALWVVVNERDELGHNLVPDYLTSVKDGGFYGWPWSYYGRTVDQRVKPPRPDMVEKAIVPDYALGSHTASLGLTFADGANLGGQFSNGAFIGQHGSWNRKPFSGYKVVFVPFANGRPSGDPIDVLTGFLRDDEARGRPVGVAIAKDGALLVADDVGNTIWRVSLAGGAARPDAGQTASVTR